MKVWQVTFTDAMEGTLLVWRTSKRGADAALAELQRDFSQAGAGYVKEVDLPRSREGLVRWLNQNLSRDNG